MGQPGQGPGGAIGRIAARAEEIVIAVILAAMVGITFVNVVLRYGFNDGIIWGLDATTVLFAWLVLFGISHAFRITAHLGVDAVVMLLPPRGRRLAGIVSGLCCLVYAALILKGAWDYWAPFAGLDATSGRWFPTGWAESRDQAWYETEIPMVDWLRWLEPLVNQGETYEKLPRLVVYFILPVGAGLLLLRVAEALAGVIAGRRESLIVSHEAEEQIAGLHQAAGDAGGR